MSVIDLLTRVDALCQKYEKYDLDKQRDQQQISGSDAFLKLYTVFETEIAACAQKANDSENEKNRAVTATLNAEIRRAKAELRNELPKLEKLANRKVKGLSKEEMAARPDLVLALAAKIDAIPDGAMGSNKPSSWGAKAAGSRMEIKIDNTDPDYIMHPEHYQQTSESNQFRQEFEMRKRRQDEGLDQISEGLATLRNMAADINEELDRQVPLMDEIDTKVDKATSDLRNTNVRLKETVTKLRSSRNFCIDIILLCVILGIAAYLYNVLKK